MIPSYISDTRNDPILHQCDDHNIICLKLRTIKPTHMIQAPLCRRKSKFYFQWMSYNVGLILCRKLDHLIHALPIQQVIISFQLK